MDSGIITEGGVITDPIEQVRAFMCPPKTPTFERVLAAYWDRLQAMYGLFLEQGESVQHTRLTKAQRQAMVDECQGIIASIKEWARDGYVLNWNVIHNSPRHDVSETQEVVVPEDTGPQTKPTGESSSAGQYPECFEQADLKAVAGSGQWVQYVRFLVENGFPTEDKFFEVISTLALWFGFVEMFGEDRQRIKDVLRSYVITRHNGRITRLLAGQDQDVFTQVDRIVDESDQDGRWSGNRGD